MLKEIEKREREMKTALLFTRKYCSVNTTLSPGTRESDTKNKRQNKQTICNPPLTEQPVVFMGSFMGLRYVLFAKLYACQDFGNSNSPAVLGAQLSAEAT